ncbi:unnamed protein product [Schistosoma margrebowiei]|uniref:Uncharacterized protein n=1 Tax=Schistosoma margrebowiei TaxID=48269 RepID=A0AA84ZNJ7_9TREM|nr:unnamed protein product [Schistosoma margrebowiei]
MNPIIFDDVANSIFKLRMYPYFDIANYILMSISVKEDTPQSGSVSFSRRHPFSCWLATMLMCFGGAILSNFITGSPLFECFDDTISVLTATVVWYLINYFPFDLLYRLCKILPVRLLVCSLKEVQRAKKIFIGVHHGLHLFPNSPVMCVLLGLLKGVGSLYMRPVSNYVLGVWDRKNNPFIIVNFTTKISLLAAIAYYCHHLDIIPLPENQLFLVIMTLFVYLRITMILLGLKDPFVPFENAVCKLLFGGTVDAIRSAFERSRSKASEAMPSNLSNVSGTTSSSTANMTGNANFSSTSTGTGQSNQGLPNSNANSFNSSGLRDATNRQTPSSGDKKRD